MPWSRLPSEIDDSSLHPDAVHSDRWIPYADATREALSHALEVDPRVYVMGQGVDDPGGLFGTTKDLHKEFGADRVFDTPLSETALMGVALGSALGGLRPVYFHNRPDFLLLAMDQLLNHAAKWSYMFGGEISAPLTVWACTGRGWGSAAQHSQALQGLFAHAPGLKVVMPSSAYDAKGLMLASIADPNPVLILEHRYNFRQRAQVPESAYLVPIGKASTRRVGADVSIVALSYMVIESLAAAEELAKEGIDCEVIDLRSVHPLDEAAILETVEKTGRLVIADTGWKTGGVNAEVAAIVAEKGLSSLKAPIKRVAAPNVPTPAGYTLEDAFYHGAEEIKTAVREVLK